MDFFEWNKVAGGVLAAGLTVALLKVVGAAPFETEAPAKPGYQVAVTEEAPAGAATQAATPNAGPDPSIADLLKSANAEEGAKVAKRCTSCHDLSKGGQNRVGPEMWNMIDSAPATHAAGFAYSDAMKKKGESGTKWGYQELYQYLKDPKAYVPGNKMAFAGIPKPQERADLIAYLRTLSDNPPPLPK